ncbi:MAG: hypothetical protein ACLPQY_11270 [Streptosporangiaceae bacterium]
MSAIALVPGRAHQTRKQQQPEGWPAHLPPGADPRGRSQLTLHLPQYWHRENKWLALFEAACGPPARAA